MPSLQKALPPELADNALRVRFLSHLSNRHELTLSMTCTVVHGNE
jgi:hypothetical protein